MSVSSLDYPFIDAEHEPRVKPGEDAFRLVHLHISFHIAILVGDSRSHGWSYVLP